MEVAGPLGCAEPELVLVLLPNIFPPPLLLLLLEEPLLDSTWSVVFASVLVGRDMPLILHVHTFVCVEILRSEHRRQEDDAFAKLMDR